MKIEDPSPNQKRERRPSKMDNPLISEGTLGQTIPMVKRATGRTIPDLTGREHVCEWQHGMTNHVVNEVSPPTIEDSIARLRTKWPQAHYERNQYGHHLIVVPSVLLPKGWDKTICTVLFLAPPGYPAARPDHFFTDIEILLADKSHPHNTNVSNGEYLGHLGWPQWAKSMWWSWHLQMWDPNRSSLFTYMKVIQQRLSPAR